jgi:chromosome segregation ATPase
MREEYEERGNFNPVKFGLIGALAVAAAVFAVLQYRSYTENKQVKEQAISDAMVEIDQLKADNGKLKADLATLKKEAEDSEAKFKKSLAQKDSVLSSTKRQMDSESRAADDKLAELKKENSELETQYAALKKDSDANAKTLRDQLTKLQSDLKMARSDAERSAKNAGVLKAKLDKISEGDQAAADVMVQQLADLRQKLKQEQATRQKLEEDLDSLKKQAPPVPE